MFSYSTSFLAISKGGQVRSSFWTGTTIERQLHTFVLSLGQDLRRSCLSTLELELVYIHSLLRVSGKIFYTLKLFILNQDNHFSPASISLPRNPTCVMSSPNGACALLVFEADDQRILTAYHWNSFGASEGIAIVLPDRHGSVSVTSFVNQQCIHLMMLDEEQGYCQSVALSITKKSSEFTFREKGTRVSVDTVKGTNYVNNCLIDCFADVWTRFPVVAAVLCQSITSSACREPKSITFISSQAHDKYASYFDDMVRTFEDQTKKPTDGQLHSISIQAKTYSALIHDLVQRPPGEISISLFPAGQWFVNLLCLLPIHIAVARDNRFVPLIDGVSSTDFESELLGAELGQIVDKLSFGWYESILRSYMADKVNHEFFVIFLNC